MLSLTVKERVLLHLLEYTRHADSLDVPAEMTQDGIAGAAGFLPSHVPQYVRPLMQEGLVGERTAHAKGSRRRRKVYDLTEKGARAATRLRDSVRSEVVTVRGPGGSREARIEELLAETRGRGALLGIVLQVMESGYVNPEAIGAPAPAALVERLGDAPQVPSFVGRSEELRELAREEGGPRVVVVRGLAGIGKSSLAAKACERLRGKTNLFWHRVRSWDSRASILAGLAEFLAAAGKPALQALLARGSTDRAAEILRADVAATECLLVFDDAHMGGQEVVEFLGVLKDVVAPAERARLVVLTRQFVPFYDRRDVAIRGIVSEMDLVGLRPEDMDAFFGDRRSPALLAAGGEVGGHPLFLELLRASAGGGPAEARTDIRRFMQEEIYARLSEEERAMMTLAALYHVPVPPEALFGDEGMTYDVLLSLARQTLLRPMSQDSYDAHDTIREFFASITAAGERDRLAAFASDQLARLADEARSDGDVASALSCLANALELTAVPEDRAGLLERTGSAYEGIGDYERSLAAYEDALALAESPRLRARILAGRGWVRNRQGSPDEALRTYEDALRLVEGEGCAEEALLLNNVGGVYYDRGEYARASESYSQSLAIRQNLGDEEGIAASLSNVGLVQFALGDYTGALSCMERGLAIRERIADQRGIAASCNNIGLVHRARGDYEKALANHERSLGVREKIGDARGMALSWNNLGVVHRARGAYDLALEYHRKALDLQERLGVAREVALSLNNLGVVQRARGDLEGALGFLNRSLEIQERVGDARGVATALNALADVRRAGGDHAGALEILERCLALQESSDQREMRSETLNAMAEAHLGLGDVRRARELANEGLDLAREMGLKGDLADALRVLGVVDRERKDWASSERNLLESIEICNAIGKPLGAGRSHYELGLLWRDRGRREEARQSLQEAISLFEGMRMASEARSAKKAYEGLEGPSSDGGA